MVAQRPEEGANYFICRRAACVRMWTKDERYVRFVIRMIPCPRKGGRAAWSLRCLLRLTWALYSKCTAPHAALNRPCSVPSPETRLCDLQKLKKSVMTASTFDADRKAEVVHCDPDNTEVVHCLAWSMSRKHLPLHKVVKFQEKSETDDDLQ